MRTDLSVFHWEIKKIFQSKQLLKSSKSRHTIKAKQRECCLESIGALWREKGEQTMNTKKGTFLIFAASSLFALGGLCVKMIPWSPLAINGARCLISCVVLGIFIKVTGRKIHLNRGILLGAACIFGTNLLYTCANKLTTAANAILLQFTAPIFIILILWLFLHEAPKRRDLLACLFVFGGIACFFLDGLGTGKMAGNLLALCSGLTYAGVFMMNKIPGADPVSSSILSHLAGGLVGLPFLVRETNFQPITVTFVLILGVFQLGVAYICFSTGIQEVTPVTASLIAGIEPVLNPILVAVVLHETITPLAGVGGLVVLVTIMAYNVLGARGTSPVPEVQ